MLYRKHEIGHIYFFLAFFTFFRSHFGSSSFPPSCFLGVLLFVVGSTRRSVITVAEAGLQWGFADEKYCQKFAPKEEVRYRWNDQDNQTIGTQTPKLHQNEFPPRPAWAVPTHFPNGVCTRWLVFVVANSVPCEWRPLALSKLSYVMTCCAALNKLVLSLGQSEQVFGFALGARGSLTGAGVPRRGCQTRAFGKGVGEWSRDCSLVPALGRASYVPRNAQVVGRGMSKV